MHIARPLSFAAKDNRMYKHCRQEGHHFVQEALPLYLKLIALLISHDIKASDNLDWVLISFSDIGKVREVMLPNKQLSSFPDRRSGSVRATLYDFARLCIA